MTKPHVLVVSPTAHIATAVFAWLIDAGCAPRVVSSFPEAKRYLPEQPAVLITEVRLREYNGLHLALRAHARGIPTILVGATDSVLESEATQLGAVYLAGPLEMQKLLAVVEPMVAAERRADQAWRAATADVSFVPSRGATALLGTRTR